LPNGLALLFLLLVFGSRLDLQLFELVDDLFAVIFGFDFLLDVQDFSVLADEECDPAREAAGFVVDAVRFGDFSVRIAQDRVVQIQGLGEVCVLLDGVAACGEVRDVELFQAFAALTERFALSRSATGKGFGVPRHDDDFLVLELCQFIVLAVAAFQFERGGFVALLQVSRSGCRAQSHGNGQGQGDNLCESH